MISEFFTAAELACRCGRPSCDAAPMDFHTLIALNDLRRAFGEPMEVESGQRCRFHNADPAVGGKPGSMHLVGRAVDIRTPNGDYAYRLLAKAMKHGFTGLGVNRGAVHLDTRPGTPMLWGY